MHVGLHIYLYLIFQLYNNEIFSGLLVTAKFAKLTVIIIRLDILYKEIKIIL